MIATVGVVFSQSNDLIDETLSQIQLSCGNGAYLALTAAGLISENSTDEEAVSFLKQEGWIGKSRSADEPMTLGEYSLALMKSFSMPGGIMYTIFPSARYASRELGYLGYISKDSGAYRSLSGSEAVSILGQIIRSRSK